MKKLPSLMSLWRGFWVVLAGHLCLVTHAAVEFTVDPAAVSSSDTRARVTLRVTGLATGELVLVQKYLDVNRNGMPDAEDWLAQQFQLTDGLAERIAGIRNVRVPGDDNPTPGATTTVINLNTSGIAQLIEGQFLFVLSSPTASFASKTSLFSVNGGNYAQAVSGVVLSGGSPVPYALIMLSSASEQDFDPMGGTVADGAGRYSMAAPPGVYSVAAFKSNFVAHLPSAPIISLTPGGSASASPALIPATATISGQMVNAANPAVGLRAVLFGAQSANGGFAIGGTDGFGRFTLPVTAGLWGMGVDDATVYSRGFVVPGNFPIFDTTTGNVSGVVIPFPRATSLFYGTITDNGTGLPGVEVEAYDSNIGESNYRSIGVTDEAGYFVVGVHAQNWSLAAGDPGDGPNLHPNYLFSQGPSWTFRNGGGGTNLLPGVAVQVNFTALPAPHQVAVSVRDATGKAIAGVQAQIHGNINGENYFAWADTDLGGQHVFNVANGDWSVNLNCFGGDNSLQSLGNYECPNNQFVTVLDNNVAVEFVVQPVGTFLLSGYLKDDAGNPIPGVTIHGDGASSLGTLTDNQGHYAFLLGAGPWTLSVDCSQLSAYGYECPPSMQVDVPNSAGEINFFAPPAHWQMRFISDPNTFAAAVGGGLALGFEGSAGPFGGLEFQGQGVVFRALAASYNQMEIAPPDFFWPNRYLNIGNRPFISGDPNEDGVEIMLTGGWNAAGFRMVDGSFPQQGESITFYAADGSVLYRLEPPAPNVQFAGAILPLPIARIVIIEAANDGDDVGYDDFLFGNVALPEPPRLHVRKAGDHCEIFWPWIGWGFQLESSGTLGPGAIWQRVDAAPLVNSGEAVVSQSAGDAMRFYRLRRAPDAN